MNLFTGIDYGSEYMKIGAIFNNKKSTQNWEDNDGDYYIPTSFNTKNLINGRLALKEGSKNRIDLLRLQLDKESPYYQNLKKKGFIENVVLEKDIKKYIAYTLASANHVSNTKSSMHSSRTVLTIPTHFNKRQKELFLECAKTAYLKRPSLFYEATAAAYYSSLPSLTHDKLENETFAVVNIGSTLEMTIVKMEESETFTILNSWHSYVPIGKLLEEKIYKMSLKDFFEKHPNISLNDIKEEKLDELMYKCKEAKITLIESKSAIISVAFFYGQIDLNANISNGAFLFESDYIVDELIENFIDSIKEYKNIITKVIVTGLTSKFSNILEKIKDYFEGIDILLAQGTEISMGAAMIAKNFKSVKEINKCKPQYVPLDVPIELNANIGIEYPPGEFKTIIPMGTILPDKKSFVIRKNDNITNINVYEGFSRKCNDNAPIGMLILPNCSLQKDKKQYLTITMEMDSEGFLKVSGKSRNNTIIGLFETKESINYNKATIEKMVNEGQSTFKTMSISFLYSMYLDNLNKYITYCEAKNINTDKLLKIKEKYSEIPDKAVNKYRKLMSFRRELIDLDICI